MDATVKSEKKWHISQDLSVIKTFNIVEKLDLHDVDYLVNFN